MGLSNYGPAESWPPDLCDPVELSERAVPSKRAMCLFFLLDAGQNSYNRTVRPNLAENSRRSTEFDNL